LRAHVGHDPVTELAQVDHASARDALSIYNETDATTNRTTFKQAGQPQGKQKGCVGKSTMQKRQCVPR
jgi:hypothetical protein